MRQDDERISVGMNRLIFSQKQRYACVAILIRALTREVKEYIFIADKVKMTIFDVLRIESLQVFTHFLVHAPENHFILDLATLGMR